MRNAIWADDGDGFLWWMLLGRWTISFSRAQTRGREGEGGTFHLVAPKPSFGRASLAIPGTPCFAPLLAIFFPPFAPHINTLGRFSMFSTAILSVTQSIETIT